MKNELFIQKFPSTFEFSIQYACVLYVCEHMQFQKFCLFLQLMENYDEISSRAVELLFIKQRKTFLALAMQMVHDEETAKDILNDSFIALWEKKDEVENHADYLFHIIKNKCIRYRRRNTVHKNVYDKIAQRERGMMEIYTRAIENFDILNIHEKEVNDIIYRVLSKVSQTDRDIFIMKKFAGKSYKEISDELGISSAMIDYSLRKTMVRMQKALVDYTPALLIIISMLDKQ